MLMKGLPLSVIDVLGLSEPEALREALELNDIEELELSVADALIDWLLEELSVADALIDWLLEELSVLEAWIDGLVV